MAVQAPESPVAASTALRVLLVEDDLADAELAVHQLRADGFDVSCDVVRTAAEFSERVVAGSYDVILADYNLPQWRGTEALAVLREKGMTTPLILVTGALGDEAAVEAIKRGAADYVLKDGLARLPLAVRRALQEQRLRAERASADQELARKLQELARSNRELEQFAYVASHDLQEPLRMVATYTQLLGERYRGKLDEKSDKYIGYAVEGALRMQGLIQDLLLFSRVTRQKCAPEAVDSNAAVERAMANLHVAIRESAATVVHDHLPTVMGDPQQLAQLLQNLIGNAVKFHHAEPPHVHICAERRGEEWVFAVRDNGIGIAPENLETIFVIFKRLHTREEYPGNGIGLAICKRIVEQHGGRIWVESQVGVGSTFRFALPVNPPRESP